jgi:hypothetical protein
MGLEANPEKIEVVADCQKGPNEEAAVEMIGALKDRSGDWRLAIRAAVIKDHWLRKHDGRVQNATTA